MVFLSSYKRHRVDGSDPLFYQQLPRTLQPSELTIFCVAAQIESGCSLFALWARHRLMVNVPPTNYATLDERGLERYNVHVPQSVPNETSIASSPDAAASFETRTIRKLRIRFLPFILLLYIISFLDRIN